MDRSFAEVRAAFDLWVRLEAGQPPAHQGTEELPQAAYEATRGAARAAAQQILRAIERRGAQHLLDEALLARITALVLEAAAAAWWQGMTIAGDGPRS